jgi:hypothetical protein
MESPEDVFDMSIKGWYRWFRDNLPMFCCGALYLCLLVMVAGTGDWRFAAVYFTYLVWWGAWCLERRRGARLELMLFMLAQVQHLQRERADERVSKT